MHDKDDLVGQYFVSRLGPQVIFWKVLRQTPSGVSIQEWSAKRNERQRLTPGEGPRISRGLESVIHRKRFIGGPVEPWIRVGTIAAHLWDGTPQSDYISDGVK